MGWGVYVYALWNLLLTTAHYIAQIFWKFSLFCIKAAKYGRILGDGRNAQQKYALFVIKQLLINNYLEINSGITTLIWICILKMMANSEAGSKTVRYIFLNYQLMGEEQVGSKFK